MKLSSVFGYLVAPNTKAEAIRGAAIPMNGRFYQLLKKLFLDSLNECKHDIAFLPEEDGSQKNHCRSLFLEHIFDPSLENGHSIAARLLGEVDGRAGSGLVFLMVGEAGKKKRFVVSRFPADFGILARGQQNKLVVELVEEVFLKNASSYKSAVYEGSNKTSDFWTGRAIDKQVNHDFPISAYWITGFLLSDFATTGKRGTERLAVAIKKAVNKSKNLEVKEELAAAVRLAKGKTGNKVTSPARFARQMGLSEASVVELKSNLHASLWEEEFRFVPDIFHAHVAFHSIRLSNGAILSAESEDFPKVFQMVHSSDAGKEVVVTTRGTIVDERLRKDSGI